MEPNEICYCGKQNVWVYVLYLLLYSYFFFDFFYFIHYIYTIWSIAVISTLFCNFFFYFIIYNLVAGKSCSNKNNYNYISSRKKRGVDWLHVWLWKTASMVLMVGLNLVVVHFNSVVHIHVCMYHINTCIFFKYIKREWVNWGISI